MCFTSMSANLENSVVATRAGKGHFSFQFQRIFKLTYNCIQSFHTVKILQARLQQCLNQEHADLWGGFWRGRGNRDQIVNTCWIMEKAREFQKNIYFCFINYTKAFDCVGHNRLWKILKEMGVPDYFTYLSPEKQQLNQTWNNWLVQNCERRMTRQNPLSVVDHNKLWKFLKSWEYQTTLHVSWETCMQIKKQQLDPDMKRLTRSKLGKEYMKTVYCYPAYLTYMQSILYKMLGWMNHKLESRFWGEISTISDMQLIL